MTEREKMLKGMIYDPLDPEISAEQAGCMELLFEFNATRPSEGEKRINLLRKMFAEFGEGSWIEPPLRANWAGKNCRFGKGVYANFNLTLVDDCEITIGDHTMIGPNVTITVAGHPILPELREKGLQYNLPVHIGKNCWLGAGVIINPGVTIGDNSVIGSGSVVTRDIPPGVVAVGVPCKVMREISDRDREFYWGNLKIDWENI